MNLLKDLNIQEINEEENNFRNKSIKYLHFLHKKHYYRVHHGIVSHLLKKVPLFWPTSLKIFKYTKKPSFRPTPQGYY